MPIIVRDYTWEQTDKMLFITVPLKGVKPQKVDLFSTEEYLKVGICCMFRILSLTCYIYIYGYLSEKVTYWIFKIFEIQKGRTFSFNDILRLCTIVVNIAIRIRA